MEGGGESVWFKYSKSISDHLAILVCFGSIISEISPKKLGHFARIDRPQQREKSRKSISGTKKMPAVTQFSAKLKLRS